MKKKWREYNGREVLAGKDGDVTGWAARFGCASAETGAN